MESEFPRIKISQNRFVATSIETSVSRIEIFPPRIPNIHLLVERFRLVSYRNGESGRRATRKHGEGGKIGRGDGGGEVELRGQTKKRNRVTTIIAVPGRKVSSLSGAMPGRQECRLGRVVETWRGGQGKVFVAEGVLKVFAEQIRGRQLGLFRHGGARAVVCPAKQDIITGGVHSRRDTSSDLLPDGFLVSLLETNKRGLLRRSS